MPASSSSSTDDDELLARIYDAAAADELDEPARRAYAKLLSERDDPRGRFITRQLDRARDGGRSTAEERALLAAHYRAWVGGAQGVVPADGVEFAHGFWDACTRLDDLDTRGYLDTAARAACVEAASWGTVRELRLRGFVPPGFLDALISGPLHRSLRTVHATHPDVLARLASWDGPFLKVRALALEPHRLARLPPAFPGLPELLRLRVTISADLDHDQRAAIDQILDGPAASGHLSQLELHVAVRDGTLRAVVERILVAVRRARPKVLRAIQLDNEPRGTVVIERDAAGVWGQLRVVWSGTAPADMRRLRDYVYELRAFPGVIVEISDVELAPHAREPLAELTRGVVERGGRVERVPVVPAWPRLSPVDPS